MFFPLTLTSIGLAGSSGQFTLTGAFTAYPGLTYEFGLITNFGTGFVCGYSVPPSTGSASMTISRSISP